MDKAKVFTNGRSQAVRLPKEYRLNESEVYIKKFGELVILIPKDTDWKVMETAASYFTEDYMQDRKQPPLQSREEPK